MAINVSNIIKKFALLAVDTKNGERIDFCFEELDDTSRNNVIDDFMEGKRIKILGPTGKSFDVSKDDFDKEYLNTFLIPRIKMMRKKKYGLKNTKYRYNKETREYEKNK